MTIGLTWYTTLVITPDERRLRKTLELTDLLIELNIATDAGGQGTTMTLREALGQLAAALETADVTWGLADAENTVGAVG